jgi:hypothetical protein
MTTFADIEALVLEHTKRPDISGTTSGAIRTATLRAHHVDFFPRDLAEGVLTYTPSSTALSYSFPNLSLLLPRVRSLKFVQGLDAVTATPVEDLEFREIDDLYDSDGNRRQHTYTLVGDTLRIFPQLATGTATAFYYQNPNVKGLEYSSWIADTYPDELSQWAAAVVFARTGFTEMATEFQRTYVVPFKEMLIGSHLLGNVS